jgi:uracil-DNA glycosylase
MKCLKLTTNIDVAAATLSIRWTRNTAQNITHGSGEYRHLRKNHKKSVRLSYTVHTVPWSRGARAKAVEHAQKTWRQARRHVLFWNNHITGL